MITKFNDITTTDKTESKVETTFNLINSNKIMVKKSTPQGHNEARQYKLTRFQDPVFGLCHENALRS